MRGQQALPKRLPPELAEGVAALWDEGWTFGDIATGPSSPLCGQVTEGLAIGIVIKERGLGHCPRCGILTPRGWPGMCQECREAGAVGPAQNQALTLVERWWRQRAAYATL